MSVFYNELSHFFTSANNPVLAQPFKAQPAPHETTASAYPLPLRSVQGLQRVAAPKAATGLTNALSSLNLPTLNPSPAALTAVAAGTAVGGLTAFNAFMDNVRLVGYGEELAVSIAESFMPHKKLDANKFLTKGPAWFRVMCGLSMAYIVGDVGAKTAVAYTNARNNGLGKQKSALYAGSVFLDRGLFQYLSTWLLPIYLIKFLASGTEKALVRLKPSLKGTIPLKVAMLLAGFLPAEFLAHVLDSATHATLDKTIRPMLGLPTAIKHVDTSINVLETRFMPNRGAFQLFSNPEQPMSQ